MTGRGYHVTDQDIKAFDLQKGGSASGASPGRQGIWLLEEPDLDAQAFFAAGKANPSTYPLVYRPGRSGVIALDGSEMNHEISATLDLARQQGYDSVILKNYTAHGGKPQAVRVIFDPSNIRSVHAAFDPEKAASPILTAGFGGPRKPPAPKTNAFAQKPGKLGTRIADGAAIATLGLQGGTAEADTGGLSAELQKANERIALAEKTVADTRSGITNLQNQLEMLQDPDLP